VSRNEARFEAHHAPKVTLLGNPPFNENTQFSWWQGFDVMRDAHLLQLL